MIAYLSGKIIDIKLPSLVLDVNGVGYKIFVTLKLLDGSKVSSNLSVWTHFAVRENSQDLYGFKEKSELEMFELLMTVPGIGPKSALSILNAAAVETLVSGVQSGDAVYLAKISGISKKNSEKIVLGLKDKLEGGTIHSEQTQSQNTVAIDALVALGYSERESREAVQKITKGEAADDPESVIKKALKKLGGH